MSEFFSTDGPLFRLLTDVTTLFILNVCTLICCLPVVTAGAALSSLNYMIMKMRDGEDGHLVKRYFKEFKVNLKGSTPVWLIFLVLSAVLYVDYFYLAYGDPGSKWLIPLFVMIILMAAVFVWAFPILARFENTFGASMKNIFIYVLAYLPRTIIQMVIYIVVVFLFTQVTAMFPLIFVCGLSLPAYLCSFIYYPVIQDAIKKIQGEDEEGSSEEGTKEDENEL